MNECPWIVKALTFKVISKVTNLLLSATSTAWLTMGSSAFTFISINTGEIFSPPAVMSISLKKKKWKIKITFYVFYFNQPFSFLLYSITMRNVKHNLHSIFLWECIFVNSKIVNKMKLQHYSHILIIYLLKSRLTFYISLLTLQFCTNLLFLIIIVELEPRKSMNKPK